MTREKSCGAIIYKKENNKTYLLLLKHKAGHWSFAKGHVEKEETEVETAIREAKEETNFDIVIDSNFRSVYTYCPYENVLKDVILFVATCQEDHFSIEKDNQEKFKMPDCLYQAEISNILKKQRLNSMSLLKLLIRISHFKRLF